METFGMIQPEVNEVWHLIAYDRIVLILDVSEHLNTFRVLILDSSLLEEVGTERFPFYIYQHRDAVLDIAERFI
jgi:hypothetical protein